MKYPKRRINLCQNGAMKAENILLRVINNRVFESCPMAFTASLSKPAYVDFFAGFFV